MAAPVAEKGIATLPVGDDKKPRTKGTPRTRLRGSRKLAENFSEANAFGFGPGQQLRRCTVVGISTHFTEALLAGAQRLYGPSPIIVQTGGGYHAWYKHRGERRLIRPNPDKPIDILGGGFVVALLRKWQRVKPNYSGHVK